MTLTNYWWLLIWVFGAGAVLNYLIPKERVIVNGKTEERWSWLAAVILVAPYVIWTANRQWFGDTEAYRRTFQDMAGSLSGISEYASGLKKDKGFYLFAYLIKCVFGNSDVLYFFILAAIQMFCMVVVWRRYSCNFWFSVFVFIASTDYMSWMHNGVRQFMAVTLIFVSTELILRKQYIWSVLIILLASTFHGSALLMIPVVFIIQGKPWNTKTMLCIAASVAALVFVNQFTNILQTMLEDTQYTNVVNDWQSWQDDGTSPIRILVYSVPTILSIIGYKWIKAEDDPLINITVNASIVSTAIGIISTGTSGIFIGRLPIYVSLWATTVLLPWEIKNLFTERSVRLVMLAAVSCFVAFFYYQMHFTWGVI